MVEEKNSKYKETNFAEREIWRGEREEKDSGGILEHPITEKQNMIDRYVLWTVCRMSTVTLCDNKRKTVNG